MKARALVLVMALAIAGTATTAAVASGGGGGTPITTPPDPPVKYPCPVYGDNYGQVEYWDDQFFPPPAVPFCGMPENVPFATCIAGKGYDLWSIDQIFIDYIIDLYLVGGADAKLGNCSFADRMFPMCYGPGANSIYYKSRADAVELYAAGAKVPVASKTAQTNYVVGDHHLTCAGGTPTGNLVSTGNGGEMLPGIHAGLLNTNPLDWTIEVS